MNHILPPSVFMKYISEYVGFGKKTGKAPRRKLNLSSEPRTGPFLWYPFHHFLRHPSEKFRI